MYSAVQNFPSSNKTSAGHQTCDELQPESGTRLASICNKIKLLLHNARLELSQIQQLQDKIDAFEVQAKGSRNNLKTYEDFAKSYELDTIEIIDASLYSTICQICSEACHENCDADEVTVIGDQIIQQCRMIKNGNCRQCVGKCSYTVHYHTQKTIKRSKRKIQDILRDIKNKCDETSEGKSAHQQKITSKEDARKILENALHQKHKDIHQFCLKLYHICPGLELSQELFIFINQLEKEKTTSKTIEATQHTSVLIRSLKDLYSRLSDESNLLERTLLGMPFSSAEKYKNNDKNLEQSVKMKKTVFAQYSTIIDSKELQELLIDELIRDQKAQHWHTSDLDGTSTTLAPIHHKIKLLLHNACLEVNQVQDLQDKIDAFEVQVKDSKSNLKTYENFAKSYEIDTIEIIDASFHSTLCQNCSEACHENCDADELTLIGDQIIQQCHVIKKGNCRQCVGKCSYTVHYHAKKTIKRSKRKIQDILRDIKNKCDETSEEKSAHQQKITSKEDARKILENALKQKAEGIKQFCIELHQICPNCDITHDLHVFIDHLDRKCVMLTGINAKNQATMLIRSLKDFYATMSNNPHLLETNLLQMIINHTQQPNRIDEDTEPCVKTKKTEDIQESTIVDTDKVKDISMTEMAKCEKSPASVVSSETDETSIKSKQEYLDTSNMAKVLIIGETGSGKSTFINYLTNYFYNGSLQNLHVAIPSKFHPNVTEKFVHSENDIQNTTQSKTDNCNQYMFSTDSKQYLFLDTPGLSDTRGAQQDDKNIAKIVDSVENLGGLIAVIIVVNGAVSRLTVNLRNVLTRLRGNLPDIIMDNVIIVLTNVTRYGNNFSIPALQLNSNVYPYYMQNSAFSQDPATWTPAALEAIQCDFDRSMNEIKNMMKTIDTFQTKSVAAFKTMKDIRNEIKTLLHKARLEVSQIQQLQDEISVFESFVKQCSSNLVTYKDYTREREIDTTEIVDAAFHSTLCRQCNQICHENCQLDESTTIGAQIFHQCWAIKNGYCQQCIGKCSYTAHYHAKKTIKKGKRKIQDILNNIKIKYDETFEEKNTYQQKITSKEDARKLLDSALKQKNEEIKQLCLRLRHICAGFDLTQELHVLIEQLETEETMLRSIEAKQQAGVLIRSLKDLCKRMADDPDLLAKTPQQMNIINTEPPSDNQGNRTVTKSAKIQSSNNSASFSQPNSIVSVSEPTSESNSYANDDVLAVIRAINKKKMAKDSNNEKSSTMVEPSTSVDKNDNGNVKPTHGCYIEDKNNDGAGQDQVRTKQTHVLQSTIVENKDLRTLTNDELIASYNSLKGCPETNLIIFELVQRSLGKSMGPLKTSEAIVEFTASIQKYSILGMSELMKEYERLKCCINAIVVSDIFNISQIPSNILSEIAVVNTLLQSNSSRASSPFKVESYQPHQSKDVLPSYSAGDSFYDEVKQQTHRNSPIINYQQYPYNHQNAYYSPVPFNVYDNSAIHHSQPFVHPGSVLQSSEEPSLDSSSHLHNTLKNMQQPQMATEHNNEYSSSNNHQSPALSTINSQPNSSRRSPCNLPDRDDKHNKINKMSTARLISTCNDARVQRNHELSNLCYNELKRRCYGDHPILIREKRALFDELCQKHQNQTLEELKQNLLHIKQTTDTHLIDGDPIRINNIPEEIIIEAAALHHLSVAKNSETGPIDK